MNFSRHFASHDDHGFSLIEAVIVTAILTIVGLGFATVMTNSQLSQNNIKARSEADNINEEIRALLSNVTACSNTLRAGNPGRKFEPGIQHIYKELRDADNNLVYSANTPLGENAIQLESYTIKNFRVGSSSSRATVTLESAINPSPQSGGAQLFAPRKVEISLEINDVTKELVSCVALAKMSDGIWTRVKGLHDDIYFVGNSTGGKVGIGTGTPTSELDVEGKIRGRAVITHARTNTAVTISGTGTQPLPNFSSSIGLQDKDVLKVSMGCSIAASSGNEIYLEPAYSGTAVIAMLPPTTMRKENGGYAPSSNVFLLRATADTSVTLSANVRMDNNGSNGLVDNCFLLAEVIGK